MKNKKKLNTWTVIIYTKYTTITQQKFISTLRDEYIQVIKNKITFISATSPKVIFIVITIPEQ